MNFNENGYIISHNKLMRNEIIDIDRDSIETLITAFASDEEKWSQAVREEVKYKDKNPDSGRDYILDEFRLKNTAGTVVSMP